LLPTIFTINPARIAKPHALEQLKADTQAFNVEIIAICETSLKPKHGSKLFLIVDYQLHRFDRVSHGFCVYEHNTLASNMYHFMRVRNVNFELLWIRVCAADLPEFVLGVCYHPPKPKYKTNDLLTTMLSDTDVISMQSFDSVIALTGDFN
jgi:hypothetical protein